MALDERYHGTVTFNGHYINPHAVLIHKCSECHNQFYAKPLWLVNGVQPHECYFHKPATRKPEVKRKVTDDDIELMKELYKQGFSMTKIADQIGVSRPTVTKYLRKAGLV